MFINIIQSIGCALYPYAMYVIQGLQVVLYMVYKVYHTGCAVTVYILHQNKIRKKRTVISNLI